MVCVGCLCVRLYVCVCLGTVVCVPPVREGEVRGVLGWQGVALAGVYTLRVCRGQGAMLPETCAGKPVKQEVVLGCIRLIELLTLPALCQ